MCTMCMCMCMCAYAYAHVYVYVYVYMCICIRIYVYMYTCIHVNTHIYIYCGWLATLVGIGVDTLPRLQHKRTRSVLDTSDAEVTVDGKSDATLPNRHRTES